MSTKKTSKVAKKTGNKPTLVKKQAPKTDKDMEDQAKVADPAPVAKATALEVEVLELQDLIVILDVVNIWADSDSCIRRVFEQAKPHLAKLVSEINAQTIKTATKG